MGTSIYYSAARGRPLSEGERTAVAAVPGRHPFSALLTQLGSDEFSYEGESFSVWPAARNEPGVIFAGATKLPRQPAAAMAAARHWCRLLTEVRRLLPDAAWRVHIDDYDIVWSEPQQAFDPGV